MWGGGRGPLFVEHLPYPAEVSPTALLEAEMAHGKLRAQRFLLRLPWCQAHPGLDYGEASEATHLGAKFKRRQKTQQLR